MVKREDLIHLIGGGVGGVVGATITCPLEIIKVRLQSTTGLAGNSVFNEPNPPYSGSNPSTSNTSSTNSSLKFRSTSTRQILENAVKTKGLTPAQAKLSELPFQKGAVASNKYQFNLNIMSHFKHIYAKEGWKAMFKGLGPTIAAVGPSKAIYFFTYNAAKRTLNDCQFVVPDSALVHMLAAASGGFATIGVVNPIQVVKTRLQLNNGKLSIMQCIGYTLRKEGIIGFYRGCVASCYGVVEAIIQFVLYEKIRLELSYYLSKFDSILPFRFFSADPQMVHFMLAGGFSKFVACCVAYPHEVVRTRTREAGYVRTGFWTHIGLIYKEGGFRALYRGIEIQMIRTIPNTAIVMATYEYTVKNLTERLNEK
uniref:Mitochondrial carrier protein n=1 Tax=Rhabditophanes sp. KR3021 TaxID=114890 RepID=A0AC35U709_9BILA